MVEDAWVFDVDGTLSNPTHRKHWIASTPKNWAAWNASMAFDKPQWEIVDFMNVGRSKGMKIIVATGREEDYRAVTEKWFLNYGITYDKMFMRKSKDYRGDDVAKKEMLDQMRIDGYNPILVFDDRDRVVKMFREQGLRVFQVAPGDF